MSLPLNFLMSEIPLFDSLSHDETQSIEQWLIYKEIKKSSRIYKQGTSGRSVCFVIEGKLSVIKRGEGGKKDVNIATIGKGQSVGEMAIIDGLTRSADVVAATNASVLILKREDFEKMVAAHPHIAVKILKSLARSLSINLRDRSDTLAKLMHI